MQHMEYVFENGILESDDFRPDPASAVEHVIDRSGLYTVIRSTSGIVVAVAEGFRITVKLSKDYKVCVFLIFALVIFWVAHRSMLSTLVKVLVT